MDVDSGQQFALVPGMFRQAASDHDRNSPSLVCAGLNSRVPLTQSHVSEVRLNEHGANGANH